MRNRCFVTCLRYKVLLFNPDIHVGRDLEGDWNAARALIAVAMESIIRCSRHDGRSI